jgi:hypothetical protein
MDHDSYVADIPITHLSTTRYDGLWVLYYKQLNISKFGPLLQTNCWETKSSILSK